MIGIIVIGHINFASGLRSAVEAIAGEQPYIEYIDFIPRHEYRTTGNTYPTGGQKCQTGKASRYSLMLPEALLATERQRL